MTRTPRCFVRGTLGRVLLLVGLMVGLGGCDWISSPADRQAIVVEAFLETGEPVPPITVRRTVPLTESDGDSRDAASGAEVVLTYDGTRIPYRERDRTPGTYVPTADSVVAPQTSWRLKVQWRGRTATAQGQTPPPLSLSTVCAEVPESPVQAIQVDSLRRDSLDIPATTDFIYAIDATVEWASPASYTPSQETPWMRTQLLPDASSFSSQVVEFFLEPAEIRREDAFEQTASGRRWRGVYAVPLDSSDVDLLPTHDLTVALVRGDTAFAEFAQSRTDPDRREPISNVEGGIGIATAVSIDSLTIDALTTPGTRRCVPEQGAAGISRTEAP